MCLFCMETRRMSCEFKQRTESAFVDSIPYCAAVKLKISVF